jgi:hypothetical protein
MKHRMGLFLTSAVLAAAIAACGSSSKPASTAAASAQPPTATTGTSTTSGSGGSGAAALSADATSAATGDIPDTQVFLVLTDKAGGFSMKYPEGWTQSGSTSDVTIRDKNNLVHVVIAGGAPPTTSSVTAELTALKRSEPTLAFQPPQQLQVTSGPVIKAVYSTESAPNAVTGKRVKLVVDRYVLSKGGRVATVDLGTPVGVDNVDAYRMMINSFRWL